MPDKGEKRERERPAGDGEEEDKSLVAGTPLIFRGLCTYSHPLPIECFSWFCWLHLLKLFMALTL